MSKYKIGQGVFIANAMISVRQKEDRWIIDDEDVRIFQKACEKVLLIRKSILRLVLGLMEILRNI